MAVPAAGPAEAARSGAAAADRTEPAGVLPVRLAAAVADPVVGTPVLVVRTGVPAAAAEVVVPAESSVVRTAEQVDQTVVQIAAAG